MKKLNILFYIIILATLLFTACEQDYHFADDGVVINGVKWATRNVDKFGKFAVKPESDGKLYQWNRSKAWSNSSGLALGWDPTDSKGTTWETKNDPCPAGWRVPTEEELESLCETDKVSNEWTTQNGTKGRRFTDIATGNSIFLPAAGLHTGLPYYVGLEGHYWSSTQYSINLMALSISFDADYKGSYAASKKIGMSVRCVCVAE